MTTVCNTFQTWIYLKYLNLKYLVFTFENKDISLFIKFIIDFYPSISKDLLINAINFPKSITPIDNKIIKTILHPCNSLLFNKNEVSVKKDNPDFDVTMSSFDGLEVCELVGLYLLDILRKEFGDNKLGLNRDNGHSRFQNLSGPESEKIKKKLWNIFKNIWVKYPVDHCFAFVESFKY